MSELTDAFRTLEAHARVKLAVVTALNEATKEAHARVKLAVVTALNEATKGLLVNANDYDMCKAEIIQAIDQMNYDDATAARIVIENHHAAEKRQHEKSEGVF